MRHHLTALALLLVIVMPAAAGDPPVPERITTLDGTVYTGMLSLSVKPDALSLMMPTGPKKVPFIFLPPEIRAAYGYNPIEGAMYAAARKRPITLNHDSNFALAQLADAKAKALREGKPLGFIVTWRNYWRADLDPRAAGDSGSAMAHYHLVYDPLVVLVHVRHEDEYGSMPPGAKAGILGPKAGGWAPKMAITTPDAMTLIEMVPAGVNKQGKLGGIKEREPVFRATWPAVEAWYQANPDMVAARERTYAALAASAAAKATRRIGISATLSAPATGAAER
ncbi:MAG: hypothetical protein RLZZ127_2909 [Planctomycetota bacterium]|jgi:hypothetical protein